MFVTFEFIVVPDNEPEMQGTLVDLDSIDFTEPQTITLAADSYLTVRLHETPALGF
jgi:hypothetical protein